MSILVQPPPRVGVRKEHLACARPGESRVVERLTPGRQIEDLPILAASSWCPLGGYLNSVLCIPYMILRLHGVRPKSLEKIIQDNKGIGT